MKTYFDSSIALQDLIDHLNSKDIHRIGLITGRNSFYECGAAVWLTQLKQQFIITHIKTFESDVKTNNLDKLLCANISNQFEVLVAIGGGSVIDMAKLFALFLSNPPSGSTADYLQLPYNFSCSAIPIIAVPITAGTGSEFTPFAVVYHENIKYSVDLPQLTPIKVYLVPSFLKSLPLNLRGQTALDALAQAIESFWSIHSTADSDAFAIQAIKLLCDNFKKYVGGDSHQAVLSSMSKAAALSGKAIAMTRTTASHALSYPMNSFFNIPHGIGVALTLGEFFDFNEDVSENDCNDPRGSAYVKHKMLELYKLLCVKDARAAKSKWHEYMDVAEVKKDLYQHGVRSESDRDIILRYGFNPERVSNNPRLVEKKWVKDMLQRITSGDIL